MEKSLNQHESTKHSSMGTAVLDYVDYNQQIPGPNGLECL